MRIALLYAMAGAMVLVPLSTAGMLALLPDQVRSIPPWFWLVWFLVSVWATLDGPYRAQWLIPVDRLYQSSRYFRCGMLLGFANVVWSVAALIYLGWWS